MRDGQAHTHTHTHISTHTQSHRATQQGEHMRRRKPMHPTRTSGDSTVAMVGFWLMADTKRLYRMRAVSYSVLSSCRINTRVHGQSDAVIRVRQLLYSTAVQQYSSTLRVQGGRSALEQQLLPTQHQHQHQHLQQPAATHGPTHPPTATSLPPHPSPSPPQQWQRPQGK